jgi:RNase H-like domain found in reverse transcriptase
MHSLIPISMTLPVWKPKLTTLKKSLNFRNHPWGTTTLVQKSSFKELLQITQESWPIAFYSRKLNSAQRNYTTMDKELLSIVKTAQQYRHILLGGQCKFYCKHKNLMFHHFKSECVLRWRATLEEFDYSFCLLSWETEFHCR